MKKIIFIALSLLWSIPSFAAVELDSDSNGGVDVSKGGTNSTTAANAAEALGVGVTDNPSFNSVHASGGNLAAANAQVTKKWITGLSYTANLTSVIYGGKHYICTSTHTAGASTEPGTGADWATVWTVGVLNNTITKDDTAPATCTDGDIWVDTNGTSGSRLSTCEEGSWVAQAGGSAGIAHATSDGNYYASKDGAWASMGAISANGLSLIGAANYAAMKTLLDTDDIQTLTGIAAGTAHLGTFTGTTIADSSTIKTALQSVETSLETKASVAGTDTQVQFNDGGAFGGDAGMTYNKSTNALTITGTVTAGDWAQTFVDGSMRSKLPENTVAMAPTGGGVEEVYNEGGAIKAVENDTEYDILLSRDIGTSVAAPNADTTGESGSVGSNSTTGKLEVTGPATGTTRVMTTPDANFTVARTDAANSFTGDQTVAGIIRGRVAFNSYTAAQTLTAATHNSGLVQMTTADEVTMWDCETANVGDTVMLWARDAEKIEVVPASGDHFNLFAGTALTAGNELDIAATAGTKVTLMCTADDTWSVVTETAASTDGSAAD